MTTSDANTSRTAAAADHSVSTGIEGLDSVLSGGLTADRIYLVEGDPGAGKTTLALQFLLEGLRRGERGLYVTLSETKSEILAIAESHGWDLRDLSMFELVAPETALEPDTQYSMFHPNESDLTDTTKAILKEVEQSRPVRVVFDSLSEMRLLAQNALRYRRQILALKQFFVGRGCTVMLLDDRTSEGADLQLQSIAHGVITLQHLAPEFGAERRRLRVLKFRGVAFRGGYHDFTIVRGGLTVFPRLVAKEYHDPFEAQTVPSGIEALDRLLGGGIDRGTSTLLMGPAGAGKSTVAVQYAYAAARRGERAALFIFDENRTTLLRRSSGLGMDLQPLIDSGLITIRQVDPAELSPGEFAHRVHEAVEERDARVIVIDSLNGYINAMPEERFLTIQLHEMLSYLAQRSVTTLLVMAQHGLVSREVESPTDASYLADSIILFRYFESAGAVRQAISVLKKRSGRHERTIRELSMSSAGIHIGEPLTQYSGVLTGTPMALSENAG